MYRKVLICKEKVRAFWSFSLHFIFSSIRLDTKMVHSAVQRILSGII